MKIAICDTETQGLNPRVDACLEVAVVLFDLVHVSVVECYSGILPADSNPVEHINGLSPALLRTITTKSAWERAHAVAVKADVVIAHNAKFDRGFIPPHIIALAPWNKPWICSKEDIRWPRRSPSNKLIEIALAHGLGLSHAHRALTDCMTIARLFERAKELGWSPLEMVQRCMPVPTATFKTANPAKVAVSNDEEIKL